MTLSSDINLTSTLFKNTKDEIIAKGGSVSGSITDYPFVINNLTITPILEIPREITLQGVYEVVSSNFYFKLPNTAEDIYDYALYCAFYSCKGLTSVDLSSLTTASGSNALYSAFYGCTGLTSVDLSSLTTVSGSSAMQNAFYNCAGLTSIDLSSLTTVSGSSTLASAFYNCAGLTSIDLSSLTTVSGSLGSAFYGCTALTTVDLSSLTTVSGSGAMQYTFRNTALSTLSFPSLNSNSFGSYTNQFNNMLQGVIGCTVHFPSNLQSVIGSWTSVTNGFGGTNTTVLFDLPATT